MAYSRQPERDGAYDKLISGLCQAAATAHAWSATALALIWRVVMACLKPLPWSARFGLGLLALSASCIWLSQSGQAWAFKQAAFDPAQIKLLREMGWVSGLEQFAEILLLVGLVVAVASLAAFVRARFFHYVLKVAGAAYVVAWVWLYRFIVQVPSQLHMADSELYDRFSRDQLWIGGTLLWLPLMLLALVILVNLARKPVLEYYRRTAADAKLGDRILKDLETHGGDSRFRTSTYWAAFGHVFILFIIPLLNRGCMEDPYGIPKGSGQPVQQKVEVKKVKKQREMVLNLNSPILFFRPEMDKKVLEDVLDETENTYQATALQALGKGGGKKGGWPHGMENARVRFIRLEYGGGDWDQQMGKGADHNLLIQFKKHTGFQIAERTESIPIRQLKKFPAHRAPPFVFITGSKNINVTAEEIKILRWYCEEEGGMIFADNGGGNFNASFRRLMSRVFPDKGWVDISSDDIIYQQPFLFPNGAPPLWHHSGNRAMGIKHQGRWVVFYHQGDMNDAWQTGHSGVSEYVADQAYKMGINVVNYSFNSYYSIHYGEE